MTGLLTSARIGILAPLEAPLFSRFVSFRLSWVAGRQASFHFHSFSLLYSDVIIPPSLLHFWPLALLFPCVCGFACTLFTSLLLLSDCILRYTFPYLF